MFIPLTSTKYNSSTSWWKRLNCTKKAYLCCAGILMPPLIPQWILHPKPPAIIQLLLPSLHMQNLSDVWCCLHAGKKDFTFFSSPHRVYTRIDLFLVDQQVLMQTEAVAINSITWSDHASIVLSITDSTSSRLSPVWRLNTFYITTAEVEREDSYPSDTFFFFFLLKTRALDKPGTPEKWICL